MTARDPDEQHRATVAVQTAVDEGTAFGELLTVAAGGFLIVASMWWVYFDMPFNQLLARARRAFSSGDESQSIIWAYGHFFIFGGAAAVGAGIAVNVDQATGHTALTNVEAGLTVTVPVAVYLITVWAIHFRYKNPGLMRDIAAPIAAFLILLSSWTSEPVLATGIVLAALLGASVAFSHGSTAT
jgi:low temperature requirement protein LtrA